MTRAFPSTEHALAALAVHASGARGHVLRAIVSPIVGVAVRARVAHGQHTDAVLLGVGLLEGAVLSPRLFAVRSTGFSRRRARRGSACGMAASGSGR